MYASDEGVRNAQLNTEIMRQAPSVLYRPTLTADGDKWCALYGADLASGVAGFGDTPAEAMHEFDKAWTTQPTPAAAFRAHSNDSN